MEDDGSATHCMVYHFLVHRHLSSYYWIWLNHQPQNSVNQSHNQSQQSTQSLGKFHHVSVPDTYYASLSVPNGHNLHDPFCDSTSTISSDENYFMQQDRSHCLLPHSFGKDSRITV